jgi:arylformamidase
MRLQDYPEQEPSNPAAAKYRDACVAGSYGVAFREFSFGADPHQSVAIYEPAKPNGTLYAFMHGGGWTNGYKENMGFMAPALLAQGITFASIGHRLAPKHVFPAGVDDCAQGLKALLARAGEFGFDASKVALGGHSSGGHYAALLAVRRDWQAALGLPADVIKACLPISGVYRFGEGSGLSVRPRFLGPEASGSEGPASPVLQIQGTPPPFFMVWGSNDFPHLRVQAGEMAKALKAAGGEVEAYEMEGRDHFSAHLAGGEPDGPWFSRAVAFLRKYAG